MKEEKEIPVRMVVKTKNKKYLARRLYQFVCENPIVVLTGCYRDGGKVIAVFEGYRDWDDVEYHITGWTQGDTPINECLLSAEWMFVITGRGVRWRA